MAPDLPLLSLPVCQRLLLFFVLSRPQRGPTLRVVFAPMIGQRRASLSVAAQRPAQYPGQVRSLPKEDPKRSGGGLGRGLEAAGYTKCCGLFSMTSPLSDVRSHPDGEDHE